ncbi:MAG: response regulator [Methylococcales bacterium]|nr:response regulator [Methylococcales bacterium]
MIEFSKKHNQTIKVHPNPYAYHFDILAETSFGLFFVSFRTDFLSNILKATEPAGHSLMLVLKGKNLIEITSQGARNVLTDRDSFKLTDVEINKILHRVSITNTAWELVDSGHDKLFNNFQEKTLYQMLTMFLIFTFLILISTYFIRRSLTENLQKVKKAEERLRLTNRIFETIPDHILVISKQYDYIHARNSYLKAIGKNYNELIGCKVDSIFSPEIFQSVIKPNLDQCLKGEEINHANWFIFPILGSRYMEVTYLPLKNKKGDVTQIIEISHDITKLRQLNEDVCQAREVADQANAAKSHFLSNISHELRTPLNAIIGFSQLLRINENKSLDEEQIDGIEHIYNGGQHLLSLINEILDLSRIESGKTDLNISDFDTTPIVQEALILIKQLAEKNQIKLNSVLSEEPCFINADPSRVKQILLNLLSNAIKYNRPQGKVSLVVEQHSNKVRFSIIDTGNGIPPEKQTEMFKPFSRLGAEKSDIEGTGIGLTITKKLIHLMKGCIDFESELGIGTTFWFELPLAKTVDLKQPQPANKDNIKTSNTCHHYQTASILYIEDNPINRLLASRIMQDNFKTIEFSMAVDGKSGIEAANKEKPRLILLDIRLPDATGYDVLKQLRLNPELDQTKIIALSADAMPDDIEKGKQSGFDGYLTKPINIPVFVETINATISHAD